MKTQSLKIQISKHIIKDKIPFLRKQNFKISINLIKQTIRNPDHTDKKSDFPKIIVSKDYDEKHIIRVVYKVDNGIIKAITIYPAEKGRYYE